MKMNHNTLLLHFFSFSLIVHFFSLNFCFFFDMEALMEAHFMGLEGDTVVRVYYINLEKIYLIIFYICWFCFLFCYVILHQNRYVLYVIVLHNLKFKPNLSLIYNFVNSFEEFCIFFRVEWLYINKNLNSL